MTDKQDDTTLDQDQALAYAKASPHSMVMVAWKDGPGDPIHCIAYPSFFPFDDMDMAVGLMAQNVTKLKAQRPPDQAAQPDLPAPAQPTIFRHRPDGPPIVDRRREEPEDGPPLG